MAKEESWGIHWFRRDLRVAGNPALQWSWKQHQGRVVGFFCFDSQFLSRPDFSANRFAFFLETLKELREELRNLGSDLLVFDVGPSEAFEKLIQHVMASGRDLPDTISWNRDYEPFARRRDSRMEEELPRKFGVRVHSERDHLVVEPHELKKDPSGGFYQIYTPFSRRWIAMLKEDSIRERIRYQSKGLHYLKERLAQKSVTPKFQLQWATIFGKAGMPQDSLEHYAAENQKRVTIALPRAGSLAAFEQLQDFARARIDEYAEKRDFPAVDGTSRLAMYLKNGSITATQVLCFLEQYEADPKAKDGRTVFLKEIVWREFYYHILFHKPEVEHEAFLEKYKRIAWSDDEKLFDAWKNGETGYPIVDAGMRQLRETGWMHNRVRMIVASFLTKDLHLNWQWGERYFMEQLLDGDLAPNNGGWQWAASTGCDPQPYFRIFNPALQSKRFDERGEYIRRFVPELGKMKAAEIHEPWEKGSPHGYPRPIVDHDEQKIGALELYKKI